MSDTETLPQWQDVAEDFKIAFPLADHSELEKRFNQQRSLAEHRQYVEHPQNAADRQSLRWAADINPGAFVDRSISNLDYKEAKRRFDAGNPRDDDYMKIANFETSHREEADQSIAEGVGHAVASIPTTIAKFAALGPLAIPAMALEQTVEGATSRAVSKGGEAYSPKNLIPAAEMGILNAAVLNRLGKWTSGVSNPFAKWAGATAVGVGELQSAQVAASLVDKILPEEYRTDANFGIIGKALDGKLGEAFKDALVETATMGGFSAAHAFGGLANKYDELRRKGVAKDSEKMRKAFAEVMEKVREGTLDMGQPKEGPTSDEELRRQFGITPPQEPAKVEPTATLAPSKRFASITDEELGAFAKMYGVSTAAERGKSFRDAIVGRLEKAIPKETLAQWENSQVKAKEPEVIRPDKPREPFSEADETAEPPGRDPVMTETPIEPGEQRTLDIYQARSELEAAKAYEVEAQKNERAGLKGMVKPLSEATAEREAAQAKLDGLLRESRRAGLAEFRDTPESYYGEGFDRPNPIRERIRDTLRGQVAFPDSEPAPLPDLEPQQPRGQESPLLLTKPQPPTLMQRLKGKGKAEVKTPEQPTVEPRAARDFTKPVEPPEPTEILGFDISKLDEREKIIMRARHVDGESYDTIGDRVGLTGSRVEQIDAKILRDLGTTKENLLEAAARESLLRQDEHNPGASKQFEGMSIEDQARAKRHKKYSFIAKQEGLLPADLHMQAGEILRIDSEVVPARNAILKDAYARLKQYKVGPSTIRNAEESDAVKGLDIVADGLVREGRLIDRPASQGGSALEQLFAILKNKSVKSKTVEQAYEEALEFLKEYRDAGIAHENEREAIRSKAKREIGSAEIAEEGIREVEREVAGEESGGKGEARSEVAGDGPEPTDAEYNAIRSRPEGDDAGFDFGQPVTSAERRVLPGGGQENAGSGLPGREIALANARIDQQRVKEGKAPILAMARQADREVWDKAMLRLERNPKASEELVDQLSKKPRPMSAEETMLVLHREVSLRNEYERATLDYIRGWKDKIPVGDLDAMSQRVSEIESLMEKTDGVAKSSGSESGRAFRLRRQLLKEDFSLGGMLQTAALAKRRPLTPEEQTKIAEMAKAIEEAQVKADVAEKALEDRFPKGGATIEERKGGPGATIEEIPLPSVKMGTPSGRMGDTKAINTPEYAEWTKARTKAAKAQGEFTSMVKKDREANQSPLQRIGDWLVKLRVNEVISGPTTLAKIASASMERLAFAPIEEAVGSAWAKVPGVAKIAAMAPREGRGFKIDVEKRAIASAMTDGILDAFEGVMNRPSELDIRAGRKDMKEWHDWQFSLHDATKAPAVSGEYARSLEHRLDHAIANGEDATSPAALMRIETLALADSQRAKFRQESWLVDSYNRFVNDLRSPKKSTESQAAGLGLRLLTPVVRIPTNLAFEVANHVFGVPTAATKAIHTHFTKGLESLKPAEADAIMRQFKKGSLGIAGLLIGAFNPQMFGGYYDPDREEGDVKAMSIRIGGKNVPSWLLHNPFLETFQIGATLRRAYDKYVNKGEGKMTARAEAAGEAIAGWFQEIPLVRETGQVGGLTSHNARERGHFVGETLKSFAVPQLVQWLAGQTDKDSQGEVIKRKPESVLQHVETGIPGLRKTVPAK